MKRTLFLKAFSEQVNNDTEEKMSIRQKRTTVLSKNYSNFLKFDFL
jgi:hypothetical protein